MFAALLGASALYAQPADTSYLVRYAANLNVGDSVTNITNAGTGSSLEINVYVFSPDEQMISCCCCVLSENGLISLSARNDLISNTLTPVTPSSITIKLVSTLATPGRICNAATAGSAASPLDVGMAAWGTTLHAVGSTYSVTETGFRPAVLSSPELARLTSFCGFIQANGSGFGICKSCRTGGLGATKR
jgi:hypothetical protein